MGRRQNETSWLTSNIVWNQSTEVFLSGFSTLCTFFHLLYEVNYQKKEVKMKNDNIETTSIQDTMRRDDGRQTNENITLNIKSKWATPNQTNKFACV